MPLWKTKWGWRYQFEHLGKRYSESGFRTKAYAQAALVAKRRELTQTSVLAQRPMGFLDLAARYLDDAQRRFAEKTYKYKSYVFRSFLEHAGDLPLDQVTVPIIEAYLATRHSNVNYNRHRKDLCALLAWAWKRKFIYENPCFYIEQMPEDKQRRAIPTGGDGPHPPGRRPGAPFSSSALSYPGPGG